VDMGTDTTNLDSLLYCLPTAEQKESPLYKKYFSILEKNRKLTARDRQSALQAGGLCIIGTSFFPEPRNEQQARGRAGRQGDPGESYVFRSIEDEGLKELISSAYLEQFHFLMDGLTEIDSRLLQKSLVNAQNALHNRSFAAIRSLNNSSSYIDRARPDFIGTRFDLVEGKLTPEELLRRWCADKTVLRQLQELQQGAPRCESSGLSCLWEHCPRLKTAKGFRAQKILTEVSVAELKSWINCGDPIAQILSKVLAQQLLLSWEEYIGIVKDTVGRVNMQEADLEKYLEQEKYRLRWRNVDLMISYIFRRK